MVRTKELTLTAANVITLLAIGIFYAQILQYVLLHLSDLFPQPGTAAEKMLLTGTSSAIAMAAVFGFNFLITRQSMLWLGVNCGLCAFVYFYVIKSWPAWSTAILVLFSSYSLFALLAFTVAPVVVGVLWHRTRKLSGFRLLLASTP